MPQLCGYQPRPAKVWALGSAGSSPLPAPGLLEFPLKTTRQTPPDDAELESRRNEGSWMNYELTMRSSVDDGSLISDFLSALAATASSRSNGRAFSSKLSWCSPNPGLMWVSGERAPAGLVPKLMLQPLLYICTVINTRQQPRHNLIAGTTWAAKSTCFVFRLNHYSIYHQDRQKNA